MSEKVYVAMKYEFGDTDLSLILLKRIYALNSLHDSFE